MTRSAIGAIVFTSSIASKTPYTCIFLLYNRFPAIALYVPFSASLESNVNIIYKLFDDIA